MLASYGQAADAKPDPGAAGGPLYHIFRAFLIDASGQIRNIYSLDFVDPELVLTDIKTLILNQEQDQHAASPAPLGQAPPSPHEENIMVNFTPYRS